MADELLAFDGFRFPIWVVLNTEAEKYMGPSVATVILSGDSPDEVDMPIFTTESRALAFIEAFPLPGHRAATVGDKMDLEIVLEVFRKRGGRYVRVDAPDGESPGTPCFEVTEFLAHMRD